MVTWRRVAACNHVLPLRVGPRLRRHCWRIRLRRLLILSRGLSSMLPLPEQGW